MTNKNNRIELLKGVLSLLIILSIFTLVSYAIYDSNKNYDDYIYEQKMKKIKVLLENKMYCQQAGLQEDCLQ